MASFMDLGFDDYWQAVKDAWTNRSIRAFDESLAISLEAIDHEKDRQQREQEQSDRPWVPSAEQAAVMALSDDRDYASEMARDQPRREAAMLRAGAETESADPSTDRVGDGSDLPIGWKQIEADNPAVMTSFETPSEAMSAVRHNDRLHLHSAELQATQAKERDDDLGR
jgi:hypothetical protein